MLPSVLRRNRVLAVIGLAVVIIVAVLIAVVASGPDDSSSGASPESPIEARAVVSPGSVLFGDTVTATVEVTLDRARVDPDSVNVRVDFTPWQAISPPERARQDGSRMTYLRTTYALRCLVDSCTSTGTSSTQTFEPARIAYVGRDEAASSGRRSIQVRWPQLFIGSRASATEGAGAQANPWQVDMLSLPSLSYGISPTTLFALLLAGSALLFVASAGLAYAGLPRRAPLRPVQVKEPPAPVLTPVERAFALLEDPMRVNGAGDQRRALEFVASLLARRGEAVLAGAARSLAWSLSPPHVTETSRLADHARIALGEEHAPTS